jgi:hypothetical protein
MNSKKKFDEYDDEGVNGKVPTRKTIWFACPHWYDEHGLFYADAHEERHHEDQRAAWADFHWCVQHGNKPGRIQFTVDLLRWEIVKRKDGQWERDGMQELLERWPGGIPAAANDPGVLEARRRGVLQYREALAAARPWMERRHDIVAAPITPTEYAEGKEGGWDIFGDPGQPNPQPADWRNDTCPTCADPYCRDPEHVR